MKHPHKSHQHIWLCFYVSVFLISNLGYACCEWFTSIGQMEDLVHDELDLLSSLREYINAEEVKLKKINRLADKYQQISENAKSNIDQYLGHPVNQYRLVKRLASEWIKMEELVVEDASSIFLSTLSVKRGHFPDEEDVKGSAQAIMRLQDTYKLDTHEIAQGIIKGLPANQSLSAEDCYHIGRTAYLEKDYYHCVLWMKEASAKEEHTYSFFSRFDVLDHLSYCYAQQGNIDEAYTITLEMLQINPFHERVNGNNNYYSALIGSRKKGDEGTVTEEPLSPTDTGNFPTLPERNYYERLCRRETNLLPKNVERRLKCYYWTNNNHPRLVLQPVKLEELWHSPHLVRFYNVVTDNEIATIKSLAKPRLYRATVRNPVTGKTEHAHYRVSKSAWLDSTIDPVVARVNQRISDITGLSMETAEELQVANYGVGGQYEPHYDFSRLSNVGKFEVEIGNRVATFLIYLSDVDFGGNTVFLGPGVAVPPIKGSAAFWYNLFPSGAGDLRTRHAACPVLTGVKWVSNKWIHERDQELRRSCKLNRYADNRIF